MDRYESSEDYLETIYMLHLEHATVRAIDVATKMNFSTASVSIAMKKLKNLNLIEINVKTESPTETTIPSENILQNK